MNLPRDPRVLKTIDARVVMERTLQEARADGRAMVFLFATGSARGIDYECGTRIARMVRRVWARTSTTGMGCG